MSTTNSNSPREFNLHTKGLGYLNRIRLVTPRKGQPFWGVEVNCLHGDGETTRFDCKVVGSDTIALFEQHLAEVGKEDKVIASVVISDIYLHQFVYTQGDRAGQPGACIKGRLLDVKYLKINGQVVHTTQVENQTQHAA